MRAHVRPGVWAAAVLGAALALGSEVLADGFGFDGHLTVQPLDFTERTIPPAVSTAGHQKCYADAPTHTLMCSYNGGAFTSVASLAGGTISGLTSIGVGVTPAATCEFDHAGGYCARQNLPTALASNTNDWALADAEFYMITASTPVSLTGMTGGADGKRRILCLKTGSSPISIIHKATSIAANQLDMPAGASTVGHAEDCFAFAYDANASLWHLYATSVARGPVATYPAQITASQNDYDPGYGQTFFLTNNGAYNITGLKAPAAGTWRERLCNLSASAFTFKHLSGLSSAVNQLSLVAATDLVLIQHQCLDFDYDTTNAVWRPAGDNTVGYDGNNLLTSATGCAATGCTVTGTFTSSGVSTDFTAPANESWSVVLPSGTGQIVLTANYTGQLGTVVQNSNVSGYSAIAFQNSTATSHGGVGFGNASAAVAPYAGHMFLYSNTAGEYIRIGNTQDVTAGNYLVKFGDNDAVSPVEFGGILGNGTWQALKFGTVGNCAVAGATPNCGTSPAGHSSIVDGATAVVVTATASTANSEVSCWWTPMPAALGVTCNTTYEECHVTAVTAGTSFTCTCAADPAGTDPICVAWEIKN